MAESSTCLVRSFSTPSDTSCVTHEGNPLRALGESISFGRYMSESLDWEKWSAFTCNRYVEEAEKYSKPGSVAAKKAYFEAHYKRKAAEKSAALVEEANVQANRNVDSETWERNGTDISAQIKSESVNIEMTNEERNKDIVDNHVVDCGDDTNQCKFGDGQNDFEMKSEADNIEIINEEVNKDTVDNQVVDSDDQCKCDVGENDLEIKSEADNIEIIHEEMNNVTVDYQVVDCDDTNQCKCDDGENDLDISEVEGAEEVLHPCNDMNLDVESCTLVDNSNQLDHVEVDKNIAIPIEEKVPDPEITGQEVLALPVKEREVNSSPKPSAETRVNKLPHSCDVRKASAALPPRIGINSSSKRENVIGDAVEKKRLTLRSLRTSINLPSSTGETSKIADAVLRPRNGISRISTSKNSVGSLVEKKRPTASSLHMSIHVPSGTGIASKLAAVMAKPRNGMNIVPISPRKTTARSLHMSINLSSGTDETSKTTSVIEHNKYTKFHCDLPKVHSVKSPKSTKASHGLLHQAQANLPSQGKRTERPLNKSVSGDVTVNANSCLKSSCTAKIIPRPPTITSAFRFRSEERAIKRKELLQSKTENVHKNLPQSSGSKSKVNDDEPSGSQSPKNHIRKISVTLPRSPRQVRQASCSSSTTKNVGNSRKPPISANNSKHITEKDNRTRQSGTSLSNTTWENASPNIQH
ncbi:hypothetical protein TSUD_326330 [Trifolium subterraneum]|uniref:TPX2 C-terminal domain-containing protein n=1 Tax=Trifolium subterraneum TaxID=3900 RepID=A0A2Z6LI42_TRISU|nr:hypothetical protein TSUD_326330 [Trifolium subterraneum]